MTNESQLRLRYLQDDVPHRMGNLASTLSRLSDFVDFNRPAESILAVLQEGEHFVKWTEPDVDARTAVELQRLALDLKSWRGFWTAPASATARAAEMSAAARAWSDRVLELSGLLTHGR